MIVNRYAYSLKLIFLPKKKWSSYSTRACDLKNKSCWELNFPIFNFKTLELRTASPRDAWKKWSQRINMSQGNETGRNRFATKSLELNPQIQVRKKLIRYSSIGVWISSPSTKPSGDGFFLHLVLDPKTKIKKGKRAKHGFGFHGSQHQKYNKTWIDLSNVNKILIG